MHCLFTLESTFLKNVHTKGLEMHPKWETPVNWLLSWQNGNFKLHRQLIVACLWNDRSIIFSFVCIESQSPWHSVLHYPPTTNHTMIFKEWWALSIMDGETHGVLFGWSCPEKKNVSTPPIERQWRWNTFNSRGATSLFVYNNNHQFFLVFITNFPKVL